MDSGWAQAIISGVAILASGGIAVLVPSLERRAARKREDRARLDITTTRWAPGGLRLDIRYVPEFTHTALRAYVAVKSPDTRLMLGRPVLNPAPMATGGYVRYEFDGECVEGRGTVHLARTDASDAFSGVMFLLSGLASEQVLKSARIEATITNAVGDRLLSAALIVSPIDEGPQAAFVVPAPVRSVRTA